MLLLFGSLIEIFGPTNFELRITICWTSLKTILNSITILFDTSLPRVVGHKMLFLCVCFAVPSTVGSHLLDDVIRNWQSIQSSLTKNLAGFAVNQQRRHSEHCTFGIVSHNLNNSTLLQSRIIAFELSLSGLWTLFCCKSARSASR